MTHVRYDDPRIYSMFAHYKWQPVQRALLEGERSWGAGTSAFEQKAVDWMLDCLSERGITFRLRDGAMTIGTRIPLPPVDEFLSRLIVQHGLDDLPAQILGLEHVEDCEGVPICKCVVYGNTGGRHPCEPATHGLQAGIYAVGRCDVRVVREGREPYYDAERRMLWRDVLHAGEVVETARGHMRGSLRRARNTAKKVAAAIPMWERYRAERAIIDCERAEEAVRPVMSDEDEELLSSVAL